MLCSKCQASSICSCKSSAAWTHPHHPCPCHRQSHDTTALTHKLCTPSHAHQSRRTNPTHPATHPEHLCPNPETSDNPRVQGPQLFCDPQGVPCVGQSGLSGSLAGELVSKLLAVRGQPLWPPDKELSLRIMLRSGVLAGQRIHHRHRQGHGHLTGMLLLPNSYHVCLQPGSEPGQGLGRLIRG